MSDALNIDALLGEQQDRTLTYKGEEFKLPAELPGAALAPFLDPNLGLIPLIQDALKDSNDDTNVVELVLDVLKKNPNLPTALLRAGEAAFRELVGEHHGRFVGLKPSVPAWFLIARALVTEYGVSLMDFFGSDESSDNGGTDSKPTSNGTTDSTPAASGDTPETKAS